MTDPIEALRRALAAAPDDEGLRVLLVQQLISADRGEEALDVIDGLATLDGIGGSNAVQLASAAVDRGELERTLALLDVARRAGVVEGVADVEQRLLGASEPERVLAEGATPSEASLDRDARVVTFGSVGGLEETKKTINRMIVLPLSRPDLYERYGRRAGGGVLLYGPPGCGKTLVARATAGEVGLPFYNLRIEDVVDPYFGASEQKLAMAFDRARELVPCVLFVDEVDALAFARGKRSSDSGRQVVDVMLQQLDSIGTDTDQLLVLASTNAPWDVDSAMLRPGRFDRQIFVPPPDEEARRAILDIHLEDRHTGEIDVDSIARATPLFSGADLRGLIEAATDLVIDEALERGGDPPLEHRHVTAALAGRKPTTLEWLNTARNYVEFANQSERWDDIAAYLKSREGRRSLKQWRE